MKKIGFSSLVLIALPFMLSLSNSDDLRKKGLVVHEWGTFTTLHSSTGEQLSGLYLEEEVLPEFVYHHNLPGKAEDRFISQKGAFIEPQNVTVKMETPVVYFYSPKAMEVSVRAEFPGGSISQWYPKRTAGDRIEDGAAAVDFASKYGGWIKWQKVNILGPKEEMALTHSDDECSNTWIAPRQTSSNLINVDGEIEKYIFYRGIGNFKIPVSYKFEENGELSITNEATYDMPFVMVYEKKENGEVSITLAEGIKSRQKLFVDLTNPLGDEVDEIIYQFKEALINQGLYEDEALAMLATWKKSYFESPGLRVFWIVPRDIINDYLVLKINPLPLELNRVFVGRSDLMTPEFEKELLQKKADNTMNELKDHRYYIAYQNWLEAHSSGN